MRLINADALMKKVCGNCQLKDCVPDVTDTVYGCIFAESIDQMPTLEAEPVRHGHWIFHEQIGGYNWKCSNCKGNFDQRFSYCPNCGAQMK